MTKKIPPYIQGITWFLASLIISCANDAITKYVTHLLHPWQITFFRSAFGTCILLPYMLYQGKASFRTQRLPLHCVRGFLLFLAMGLWGYGIQHTPITTATIMSFTVPIFVLALAPIFLKEKVTWQMWLVTIIGFIGIVFALQKPGNWSWHFSSIAFVIAALLFSSLDIINKKFVNHEPMLCMLFYSSLASTLFTASPAIYYWNTPTSTALYLLFLLGIGGNFILYLLLKAFSIVNASFLAPFRYIELLISIGVGYLIFYELPNRNSYISALIIIPCSLFIVYHQSKQNN